MLLGTWRNIEELEEALCLDELRLIIDSMREKELRNQKFLAAIQGIDISKAFAQSAEDDFKRVQDRVKARLAGQSDEEFRITSIGFDVETDDDEEQPEATVTPLFDTEDEQL